MREKRAGLEEMQVNVRVKLAGLWASLMFCYIYGDYFELYQRGKLQQMLAGATALGPATQGTLFGMSLLLVIPAVMIFLALIVPAYLNRWLNLVLGVVYTAVMVLAIQGAWYFYVFFGLVEITLTLLIVWYAWRWPRHPASTPDETSGIS